MKTSVAQHRSLGNQAADVSAEWCTLHPFDDDACCKTAARWLAGEIVTNVPDKDVTVVCSGARLIPDKPPSIGQRALEYLQSRGAKARCLQ